MSADKTFHVTVDPVKNGVVELDPPLPAGGHYAEGTVVRVTATPTEGYAIDSVYYSIPGMWGAAYQESPEASLQVLIDRDKHVGASFVPSGEVEHVKVINNVVYAQPGKKALKYDVYTPGVEKRLPIIVIIHGGGWASNDEDVMRGLGRELCRGGRFVACSIDYRWIGRGDGDEVPNTMAHLIEDVFGAIVHIWEHAAEYGGDPERIGVTGDSAGGHLAAVASLMTNKIGEGGFGSSPGVYEFKPTYLTAGKSVDEIRKEMMVSIRAAAPSYGVFSARAFGRFQKMPAELAAAIAPQSNIPPAEERSVPQYLLRGTRDFLIQDKDVAEFVDALKAQGQTAIYVQVPDAGHAFFDWKPNDEVKGTFQKYGVPYAEELKTFFGQTLSVTDAK